MNDDKKAKQPPRQDLPPWLRSYSDADPVAADPQPAKPAPVLRPDFGRDARKDSAVDVGGRKAAVAAQQAALTVAVEHTEDGVRPVRRGHPSGKSRSKRSPDQETLYRFRNDHGLTQIAMATLLGARLATYQAWEYGKTKGVPKKIFAKLRELQIDPDYMYVKSAYSGMSARDIALEWARRMDIPDNRPTELARALGVNPSNACRWLNESKNVVFRPDQLVAYERRVQREERFLEEANKRHPGRSVRGDWKPRSKDK